MSLVTFARNRQQRVKWNGLGRLGTVVFMIAGLGWSAAWAADPPRSPVAPQDSLAHLQLAPGLRAELVAAEPQVTDPVAIRFDAQGRMWVVEMRDYPWGPKEGELPQCQLRVLTDEDGDGAADEGVGVLTGLLHDADYEKWPEDHPKRIVGWLRERGEEELAYAISAHYTKWNVPYKSQLDKALLACDELTGFIVACCLVRPEGVSTLAPKSVKKKLKDKAFAAKVERAEVYTGVELLEADLGEHIQFIIDALKPYAEELGIQGRDLRKN